MADHLDIRAVTERIMRDIRSNLGERWDGLGEQDRLLVAACADDAALLMIQSLAQDGSASAAARLLREKGHINAQLLNIAAGEATRVQAALWGAVRGAVQGLVGIAVASI